MFAASRVRHLALFDPGALGEPLELSKEEFDPRLRKLAEARRVALLHFPQGDCEASITLFVNEDLPDWLTKASEKAGERRFQLEVPSGKIVAAGAEDVFRPQSERELESHSQAHVPPGLYLGTVYTAIAWKARHQAKYLANRSTVWSRRFAAFERVSGVLVAALLVFHLIVFAPVVGFAFQRSLRAGIIALGIVGGTDLIALAVLRGSTYLSRRFPTLRAARAAAEEFEAEYPDILVALSVAAPDASQAPAQNLLELKL